MRYHLGWLLGAGLLAGALCAGSARAQSQPDPAAQDQPAAQQNTKTAPDAASNSKDSANSSTAKKVYTNEDLRSMDPGGVSVVGNSRGAARSGTSTAPNGQAKNEQYWRNRAQKLRAQMAEVDRQIAELTAANQPPGAGTGSSNGSTPPPPPSAYYGGSRASNEYQNQLRRLNNRKAQLQQQMDQLEDEGRRAGVPPGWLR